MIEFNRIPLIIDCDPGIDDAFAIVYAHLTKQFDLKAIVSVAGNVPIESTTQNADFLINKLEMNCPLIRGAVKPLIGEPIIAKYAHGANGLGGYQFDTNFNSAIVEGNASDLFYETLKSSKDKVVIAAIGPLTNIAKLLLAYPDALDYIDSIYIMGGAIKRGNYTARAEFNIAADPLAAKIVLNAGLKMYLLPLDTSEAIHFTREFFFQLEKGTELSKMLYDIVDARVDFKNNLEQPHLYLHDMLTISAIIHPEFFNMIECNINVETEGQLTKGETIFDLRDTIRRLPSNGTYIAYKSQEELINHILEVLI